MENLIEILVKQGKSVLTNMKDLKRLSHKKNKDRAATYERLSANQHSFNVHTYVDPNIGQSNEVQAFKQKLEEFNGIFVGVGTDFEKEVNEELVGPIFEETLVLYNEMVTALGYEREIVNPKRF